MQSHLRTGSWHGAWMLALLMGNPAVAKPPPGWHDKYESAQREAARTGKPIFAFFR